MFVKSFEGLKKWEKEVAKRANLKTIKGQEWLQRGFFIVTNAAVIDTRLTAMDLRIYEVLLMHLFKKETCFPSQTTIAKEAGLKYRVTANKHIKKLISLGYLTVEPRKGETLIYRPIVR